MTHTPGEWVLHNYGAPNNIDIVTEMEQFIGEVYCPPMLDEYLVPERPECEANARLIAAAPDFATACAEQGLTADDAIAATLDQLYAKGESRGLAILAAELRERTAKRRAALAKATGTR